MLYSNEKEYLLRGLEKLRLTISDQQVEQLMLYLQLLVKWNRAYNLSAIREPLEMVKLHLLDSLAIAGHLTGTRLIDVGTGAGLPGVPLAIIYPDKHFTLLDSVGKKARFLVQVQQSLALTNLQVENCRVETFQPEALFDGVISRAFSSLRDMTEKCHHLLIPGGHFWAMKGLYPQDELRVIEKHYRVDAYYELNVPGVDAHRCLLCLSSSNSPAAQVAEH